MCLLEEMNKINWEKIVKEIIKILNWLDITNLTYK